MAKDYISRLLRANNTVFTFKDISLIWGETEGNKVKKRVHRYIKAGKLYPIRRGIYAKDKNYSKFELAAKIYTPSYISLETVLQKEGVIFQYYQRIFVVSYLAREIDCDGQAYVYRKIKDRVLTNSLGVKTGDNFNMATKERAFLDTLYFNKNYHFDNLASIDWDKCFEIIKIYENKTMIKKLDSYYKNYAR